ncbi:transglycosylase domain-containing protein [Subtercola sp. Z020]|uniref:transglycosylase domain-containing protein n=1 Tax=Subtercola sp. Z020 TaxID=2080582 RepID=UPI00130D5252|nr:transglycosylase domain-containing protein [Subtercola sp. Z020]
MSAIAGVLVTAMVTPALAVTGLAANNSIGVFENLPSYIKPDALAQTSSVYGKNEDGSNVLLASFYEQNRQTVGWNDISQFAKDALVSTEDPRFYVHGGVDVQSTFRALVGNVVSGGISSGASTISQQYVKNILVQRAEAIDDPTQEAAAYAEATAQTTDRKLKEAKLAIGLEKEYSKDDILLGYMNIALFGGRVYGIQAASEYYFGIPASQLSLPQAASLIAIVNEPEALRIDLDEEHTAANKARRDKDVLASMLKEHTITQAQFDEAVATPVTPNITEPSTGCQTAVHGAGFFCDYVKKIIEQDPTFGDTADARDKNLATGGYQIYTTLDMKLQTQADETVKYYAPYDASNLDLGAVLVTVEPGTGRVTSMAQNKNFSEEPDAPADSTSVNYSTDAAYGGSTGFQVGSTYKLFTLIAWLQSGRSLGDIVNGSNGQSYNLANFKNTCGGASGGTYKPGNDAGEAGGRASVLNQFEESVNNAFITMQQSLDQCAIRDVATSLGVHRANDAPLDTYVAAGLGTNEIAPLTMAAAYAGVINKGLYCSPVAIDSITDANGAPVAVPQANCTQAIDPAIAQAAAYAMQGVIQSGTATPANPSDGTPHAGKTGTTDNEESIWLVGGTTKLVTASWTGNVTGHVSIRHTSIYGPGSGPVNSGYTRLYMWRDFYKQTGDSYGGDSFPVPPRNLSAGQSVKVPDVTGLSIDAAISKLENAGFEANDAGEQDSNRTAGQVSSTDPAAGTSATKGADIDVFTSNGKLKSLPDVTGKIPIDSVNTLKGQGWNVTQQVSPDAGCKKNSVVSQTPETGDYNQSTTPVTLVICQ